MNYLRWDDLFEYGDKVCSAEQEILMVSVLKLSLKNLCLRKSAYVYGGGGGGRNEGLSSMNLIVVIIDVYTFQEVPILFSFKVRSFSIRALPMTRSTSIALRDTSVLRKKTRPIFLRHLLLRGEKS